ncbi:platelet-activating factor acetylhydrolase IB subunit gamma [Lingula anatina]|uniref:Platelet-activating factor acetylhydrolase IB subunit gamma n=1 Tax=Lingula anatina TaxID=7574 RepID=A0A1S3I2F8_LINAN|nr:platelet-activating factor acetylhydrolase IB subunit gamma [Lingula anatina]|eukprot:XP_013392016.1 platelet-activating factor acetylhydrolase IB subunit gamma [Lingula anatina]
MNPAAVAVPVEDTHGDGRWMSLHNRFKTETKDREPDVLMIGDSLIQQLGNTEMWEKMFVPLHCLNFGIGADQTQHVLWRLQHGELDNINPKIIVLLVGTNNHGHTADQVTEGILEIVKCIRDKQPQAQLIVMGIPPRGQHHNPLREKIATINTALAEKLSSLVNTQFLNVDPGIFLNPADGSISRQDMYDYLHFTQKGYRKLCEPLLEELQNLLKNFVKVESDMGEVEGAAAE